MKSLRLLFILLNLLFTSSIYSQSQEYFPRIEFFSIPNSAINSEEISDIKIDSDGYVWIVSFKGLYRYDGENFQKISANYNSYGSLIRFYEGNRGEKFVIDYWGAIYFVDNDSLYEYQYNSQLRKLYRGYGYSDVDFIDKELNFSFNSSSFKTLKNGKIKDPLQENNINFKGFGIQIKENRKPFIFTGNSLNKIEENWFYLFDSKWKVLDSLKLEYQNYKNPTSLTELKNGNYLFSNGVGNIIEFNSTQVVSSKVYKSQIINLFVDASFNLWVSTRGEGIHFYKSGNYKEGDYQHLLPNSTTIVNAQDYQKGIWLYSQKDGVGYISHPEMKFLNQNSNVKPLVETFEATENGIYFTEENQLKKIGRSDSVSEIDVNFESQIMRLHYDNFRSKLWVSTRKGLSFITNENEKFDIDLKSKINGSFPYFSSYWNQKSTSLYASCGYQYFSVKEDTINYISRKYEQKLKGVLVKSDSNYVNTGNGLYLESDNNSEYLGKYNDLAKKSADQVVIFKNNIFLSIPSEGVYRLNGIKFKGIEYNGELIPASQMVLQGDSIMWAISNFGTYRITEDENNFEVKAYNALPRMVLKKAEIWNNKLYVQSRNSGIGVLDLDNFNQGKIQSPKLLITKVEVGGKRFYKNFDLGKIDYDNNNLQISFKSLNYHELDVEYRYRLNNENWTNTNTGFVNYVSLSASDYSFEVQSRFGIGKWSNSKKINFEVVPPYWQEWWFIILCSLLVLFIVYQVIGFRFRLLNKEKLLTIGRLTAEQKALRAKMDPHFMFNVISSVQYLILRKENKKATLFLNKFSSLLRRTLEQTDDEMISIVNEVKFLSEYIELEKMRMEDKFSYDVMLDEQINKQEKIPTFLIQPLVENAIHHGLKTKKEQGQLSILFKASGSILEVTVKDNGMGIQKSKSQKKSRVNHTSYGMQTIEDRLKIYNTKEIKNGIVVEDLASDSAGLSGTKITLFIKREDYESANTRR